MKKGIIIAYLLIFTVLVFGQNKKQGKLAISIKTIDSLSLKPIGKVMGYLLFEDGVIASINIDSLMNGFCLNEKVCDYLKYYLWLPENHYTMIIEGFYEYPIVFTEIVMNKNKMSFLSIDFEEIGKIKVSNPKMVVIDYYKDFEKNMGKTYPNSYPSKKRVKNRSQYPLAR